MPKPCWYIVAYESKDGPQKRTFWVGHKWKPYLDEAKAFQTENGAHAYISKKGIEAPVGYCEPTVERHSEYDDPQWSEWADGVIRGCEQAIIDLQNRVHRLEKADDEEDDEEEEPAPVDREMRFVITCTKECKPGTKCKPTILYYCGDLLQGKSRAGLWLSSPDERTLMVFRSKDAAVKVGNRLTLPSVNHGDLKVILQQRDFFEDGEETDWEEMETVYYFNRDEESEEDEQDD